MSTEIKKPAKKKEAEAMEVEKESEEKVLKKSRSKPKSSDDNDFLLYVRSGDVTDWKKFKSIDSLLKSLVKTICLVEKRVVPQADNVKAYEKFLDNRLKAEDQKIIEYSYVQLVNVETIN